MLNPPGLQDWRPPQGYQAVDSTLEGVTVYAPVPKTVEESAPRTYTCPQCGATTRYDVATSSVACEHCGYLAAAQASAVNVRAEQMEFTLETLSQADKGWGTERKLLHCDQCGAEMSIENTALTTTCPFCASNRVNVRVAPTDNLRPRLIIPFKITAEAMRKRTVEWLGKGWYHPDGLAQSTVINRLMGIYLSYWVFDARIDSRWKAEVGYERQERHYNASSKSWETRTVIDWRWESGQVTTHVNNLLIPGTARVNATILQKILPFQMNALAAYNPDFLAGWQAQTYDVTLPAAWQTGKERMREQARTDCRGQIHSSHVRNFSMTGDFADEAWRYALLPVYLATYLYESKPYQVMVNGQTGTVAGQKPVAWWKVWLAIAALLAPGLLFGLVGLITLVLGVGLIPLGIGGVLLVVGLVVAVILYRQASQSEAG